GGDPQGRGEPVIMSGIVRITRRDFLRHTGVGAGALVLGWSIFPTEPVSASGLIDNLRNGFPVPNIPFVAIKLNGDIVIITHRSEMGQGIRSSLAAVLADELEADWKRVTLRQADADAVNFGVPFPYPTPGAPAIVKGEDAQFVDSSRSMAAYYQPMRVFGAGIRLVMIRAAAKKWGVDPAECRAEQHRVYHGNRSVDYRHLLRLTKKVPAPSFDESMAALKPLKQCRYIGKDTMPFVDSRNMVTGKAVYGADVERPGMLTGMIERCPVANGTLKSYDPKVALA